LAAAAREVSGRSERIGAAYATNAAFLAAAGVPTVVFGPGSIQQAHTADEWIALDQVQQAAEILYRFARHAAG
jgi:acetylornithine deacetylase